MRADRLLSILLLLQTRGRISARALAMELEVSERTVLRDMDALGASGVPIVSHRGANGGWELMDGYRTDLTGLNESEVQALFLGTPPKLLSDLNLARASDAALLKLLSALPSVSRAGAEYARQRIHVDLSGWNTAREPVPLLPALQDAVFRERRIRIEYTHGPRDVDPVGLVAKGSIWYLVAAVDGVPRTYRVSRITAVAPLSEAAVRPPDFDLPSFWNASMKEFRERLPRVDVIALVQKEALRSVELFLRYGSIDRIEEHEEQLLRVEMHFDNVEAAAVSLTRIGVDVLEPPSVREEIARIARSVLSTT